MTNDGVSQVLNLQEAVEKAFKAGVDFTLANCTGIDYENEEFDLRSGVSIDKAVTDYINGNL